MKRDHALILKVTIIQVYKMLEHGYCMEIEAVDSRYTPGTRHIRSKFAVYPVDQGKG